MEYTIDLTAFQHEEVNRFLSLWEQYYHAAMEDAAKVLEAALQQAVIDAVYAYYGTYSPKQYIRTDQLRHVYDVDVKYDFSSDELIVHGKKEPEVSSIQYYSEADHGEGPEHRPLTAIEMKKVVGMIVNGVRPSPPWRNVNYPSEYGPIQINVPLLNATCSGMGIQEILSGEDMRFAIEAYLYNVTIQSYTSACKDFLRGK